MNTTCESCVFFESQSCKLKKLDKFQERGAKISPGPVIDRVCVYHRPESWLVNNDDPEKNVEQEVYPKITAIMSCPTIAEFVNLITNIKFEAVLVLLNKNSEHFAPSYRDQGNKAGVPTMVRTFLNNDPFAQADDALFTSKVPTSQYMWIDNAKKVPHDILDILDNFVNKELYKYLYIEGDGWYISMTDFHKLWKKDIKQNLTDKQLDNLIFSYEELCDIERGPRTTNKVLRSKMSS